MSGSTCLRCHQSLGPELPAWHDDRGEPLCVPCAMGLVLPDRPAGADAPASPRFALPPAVAGAISAEIDLGTGRTWPVAIVEFSVEGMRLDTPVPFAVGTPAVVVLRDRAGQVAPAVFAVEVRWVRPSPAGRGLVGVRVIAGVDGHHAAFLSRLLERVAASKGGRRSPEPSSARDRSARDRT
ncbi:MAG TPA: PilZ domain-containing protein [Thermodesulfobacteriota bacterium]